MLNPTEQTPLSALRLGELVLETGFTPGVVNIVPGYGDTAGAALAAHSHVDKVAFTGSTEVGKLLVQAAAGNLKKISLELGGQSPNIALEDADLGTAIPGAASAVFFNNGQYCCAGTRLYIHKQQFDQVVDGVATAAKKIKLVSGMLPDTVMGSLISEEQMNRVMNYLNAGNREGARTMTGGRRKGERGFFVEPTVLVDTKAGMKVMEEEIFGPVVCAMPFTEVEEVIPRRKRTFTARPSRCGRATSVRPTTSPTNSRPARCGSTATTCSTRR